MPFWIFANLGQTTINWSTVGHVATAVAALAAVTGVLLTSCYNVRQLALSENEFRKDWECEFLYWQEESFAELWERSVSVAEMTRAQKEAVDEFLLNSVTDDSEISVIGKRPGKGVELMRRQLKPEILLPELIALRELVDGHAVFFRAPLRESVADLISHLPNSLNEVLLPLDVQETWSFVRQLRRKIGDELNCARTALATICDPEVATGTRLRRDVQCPA